MSVCPLTRLNGPCTVPLGALAGLQHASTRRSPVERAPPYGLHTWVSNCSSTSKARGKSIGLRRYRGDSPVVLYSKDEVVHVVTVGLRWHLGILLYLAVPSRWSVWIMYPARIEARSNGIQ